MIVREYSLASSYAPTICRIHNITYSKEHGDCMYCASETKGKTKGGCIPSQYPCLEVKVKYHQSGRLVKGQLHPDSIQATGESHKCSYFACKKDFEENHKEIEEFAEEWRRRGDEKFPCFYNTEELGKVILIKRHSKAHVINSMVWPSLVIIVCGVIFLHLETKRRGMPFCGEKVVGNTCSPKQWKQKDSGSNGKQAHHTLLETYPNSDNYSKVKCKLAQNCSERQELFHSMPSQIDQIRQPAPGHNQGPKIVIEDVTRSISADGLYDFAHGNPELNAPGKKKSQLGSSHRQDSTQSAGSGGSQGSRLTGMETPV